MFSHFPFEERLSMMEVHVCEGWGKGGSTGSQRSDWRNKDKILLTERQVPRKVQQLL